MAKQRGEPYCAPAFDAGSSLHCVVAGCSAPIVAEVHVHSYGDASEMFRGIRRKKLSSRRPGKSAFLSARNT
jgi:hypothetical protein